mgnify:CR=1 FL=1
MNILKVIWEIMLKNFRIIYRAKTSSLIILLGPLLIVAIIGAAFNTTGLQAITIAYTSEEENQIVSDILARLKDKDYTVISYNDIEKCKDSVKTSKAHVCIKFPKGLESAFESSSTTVEFYLDISRVNLAMGIWQAMSTKVGQKSDELSFGFIQQLLETLGKATKQMDEGKKTLNDLVTGAKQLDASIIELTKQIETGLTEGTTKVNTAISEAEAALTTFKIKVTEAQSFIENLNIEDQKEASLGYIDEISTGLSGTQSLIDDMISETGAIKATFCQNPATAGCSDIDGLLLDLQNEKNAISNYQSILTSTKAGIENFGTSELSTVTSDLTTTYGLLEDFENDLKLLATDVNALDITDELKTKLGEAQTVLKSNLESVENMSANLDELSKELSEATSIETKQVLQPIKTILKPVSAEKSAFDFLFPSLITLVIMFIAILLSSTTILNEKKSYAYFRNQITPIYGAVFTIGIALSNLVIVMIQTLVLLLIATIFFSINVISNIPSLLLTLILVSLLFVMVGTLIGYVFKSAETSTIASITLSVVLLFFSSLVVPIEKMTATLAFFASKSPFVLSETIFRKIFIFETGLGSSILEVIILTSYVVILTILAILAQKWVIKKV